MYNVVMKIFDMVRFIMYVFVRVWSCWFWYIIVNIMELLIIEVNDMIRMRNDLNIMVERVLVFIVGWLLNSRLNVFEFDLNVIVFFNFYVGFVNLGCCLLMN